MKYYVNQVSLRRIVEINILNCRDPIIIIIIVVVGLLSGARIQCTTDTRIMEGNIIIFSKGKC